MLRPRVIPVLLAKDSGLVKTRGFRDPVYVGDPINAIRIFNEKEVDELVLLDITSPRVAGPNLSLIEAVASECFMPLAYGGGIRDLSDARAAFSLGVEKVVLRTAAAIDLGVVRQIVDHGGSQSIAVCVDLKRGRWGGGLRVHAPGTPRDKDPDWLGFLAAAEAAGAGEIVLNSVDRDGSMQGLDLQSVESAAQRVATPLLAIGGVGSLADIRSGLDAGATAVGAGSFFVFHGPRRAVLISYPSQDELGSLGALSDE